MKQGCIIFAYNGHIDYGSQAVLAAGLVIKHLNIPVSLITDQSTLGKIGNPSIFEHVIIQENKSANTRNLHNGPDVITKIDFNNTNRSSVYKLTPYDRTLVIDSDFLVFSSRLTTYLDCDQDFLICSSMQDLYPNRPGSSVLLAPSSIPMLWATNMIFNKTKEVEILFNLIEHIRDNWIYYSALYKFNSARYRNDYAFSIACHIMGGHGLDKFYTELPAPILFTDKDKLVKISECGSLTFLMSFNEGRLAKTHGQDIHMMNKYDILDNIDQLTDLSR